MKTGAQLEALLLYRGQPVSKRELCEILSISGTELAAAAEELRLALEGRGVQLIETEDALALGTAHEAHELIEKLEKEEYSSELSRAALETLALITYEGPVPKSRIDYVRGVNANFILRSLLTRGLIERTIDPKNARHVLYQPTVEFMAHLGIGTPTELPEYAGVRKSLAERLAALESEQKKTNQIIEDLETDPDHHDD